MRIIDRIDDISPTDLDDYRTTFTVAAENNETEFHMTYWLWNQVQNGEYTEPEIDFKHVHRNVFKVSFTYDHRNTR